MRVLMAGATITAATTTTTIPDATGAVATMDGPTADGAQELAGAGDGVEHRGSVIYGYYFNPYPVYAAPAFWITDYLIAANLQAAYAAAAEANATANANAAPQRR